MVGARRLSPQDLAPYGLRFDPMARAFVETPTTRPLPEDASFREGVLAAVKLAGWGAWRM